MAKRKSAKTELTPTSASAPTRTRRSRAGAAVSVPTLAPAVALRVAPTNGPHQPARQEPTSLQQTPKATPRDAASASQPKQPRKMSGKRFGDLREALADGWEIVQPIFARPLWSATDDSQTAFNFVLRRDQATRLLTIPQSRTVERFIASHSLQVDERR